VARVQLSFEQSIVVHSSVKIIGNHRTVQSCGSVMYEPRVVKPQVAQVASVTVAVPTGSPSKAHEWVDASLMDPNLYIACSASHFEHLL
jgi:hypothetical protein